MLRFTSLGSGSSGNATVVEAGGLRPTRLLIDCGLGPRVLAQRMGAAGLELSDIDALFITHEHGDHVGCAMTLARRLGKPIWMSEGTWRACGAPDLGDLLHWARADQPIELGNLELRPFAVPHDAAEPLQLSVNDGNRTLGVLTDLGHAPEEVRSRLWGCHALLLECNHDSQMLEQSSYPAFLKRRVGGDLGHLSNQQAGEIAAGLAGPLARVVAAHLSERNNLPALAKGTLRQALGDGVEITVADASSGCPWTPV